MTARRSAAGAPRAGFTLLEVLIAVTILGVAVVSLVGLQARNIRLIAETQDLTVAGALASQLIATAHVDPAIAEGVTVGDFTDDPADADGQSRFYGGPPALGLAWTREVLPTALPDMLQVRVKVHARGDPGHPLAELWTAVHKPLP